MATFQPAIGDPFLTARQQPNLTRFLHHLKFESGYFYPISYGRAHTVRSSGTTLAVQSFGLLERNDEELLEQAAASVGGKKEERGKMRTAVLMERVKQVVSVIAQIAISRRVKRYQLALKGGYPLSWSMEIEHISSIS